MYCSKCGTKLSEGVKFCPKCGKQTSVTNSEVTNSDALPDKNASGVIDTGNNNLVAEKTSFFQNIKNRIAGFRNNRRISFAGYN